MATAASLTDDLLVEILSRLPVRSLCRCKCVSATWRDLITHPDHREKLPHTLVGFFNMHHNAPVPTPRFINVAGTGRPLASPNFDFLPEHHRIFLLACCNGLLLCRCWEGQDDFHYFVCNPATKQWVRLPDSINAGKMWTAGLGFDPAVSAHFHVFEFLLDEDDDTITRGEVYSSKTGGWVHMENGWGDDVLVPDTGNVFLNGCLYSLTNEHGVAVVDNEGKTWRNIPLPNGHKFGFIPQSQGCLHYANFIKTEGGVFRLEIYILENNGSQEWILKHSTEASDVVDLRQGIVWVAMHPDCNLIFLTVGWNNKLISYDMDRHQVQEICDLVEDPESLYMPYVPLYSELQTLRM